MRIPLADPGAVDSRHSEAIDSALRRVSRSGRYILGPEVDAFEDEFSRYAGNAFGVGVGNGTDALLVGLLALGIGPGDAVVTVSHTAIATVAAIHASGATPVLVDVGRKDALIDCDVLLRALDDIDADAGPVPKGSVRAVVAVHLYGAVANLDRLRDLASARGLHLIEDCAQAHGASRDGRRAGTIGVFAAYSFYPTKNLGALGDAGMLVTSDRTLAEEVRRIRQYGWERPQFSTRPGVNSRLDELQAAVLRAKLAKLDQDNQRRRDIAARYRAGLADADIALPQSPAGHAYHHFVVRDAARDSLAAHLDAEGIGTGIHYAVPVHLQPGYAPHVRVASSGLCETERWAAEVLSIPVHPALSDDDVDRVIIAIRGWRSGSR